MRSPPLVDPGNETGCTCSSILFPRSIFYQTKLFAYQNGGHCRGRGTHDRPPHVSRLREFLLVRLFQIRHNGLPCSAFVVLSPLLSGVHIPPRSFSSCSDSQARRAAALP